MTPTDHAGLASRLDDFAGSFSFLSRVLLTPADEALLTRLAEPGLLTDWPLGPDEATDRGLGLLAEAVGLGDVAAAQATELTRDYAALFVGPGALLAAPYESVHRTVDGLVFDVPTHEVRAAYRSFGFEAPRLNREPDDHLGLELHFVAELCGLALDALERNDEFALDVTLAGLQAFLAEHLLQWGPHCLDLVASNATTGFYRGVAALGRGALNQARDCFIGAEAVA